MEGKRFKKFVLSVITDGRASQIADVLSVDIIPEKIKTDAGSQWAGCPQEGGSNGS